MSDVDSLRVIVVDDEPLARAVVREFLGAHPGVEIVAECANGFDAVKAVTELAPDLMFLDVQMPKLDGFEVLELLGRARAGDLHDRATTSTRCARSTCTRSTTSSSRSARSAWRRRCPARAAGSRA